MRLDYKFDYDVTKFKVISDSKIDMLDQKYYKSIIYNLGAFFLHTNKMGIIVKNRGNEATFLIIRSGDKKKLNMIITPYKVKVVINNRSYTFLHDIAQDGVFVSLEEVIYDDEVKVVENFAPHMVNFKIGIQDRVFVLDIPIDIDYVVDKDIFKSINYNSDLNDLKKIYDNYFRRGQEKVSYDFYNMDTVLGIYDFLFFNEKSSIVKRYRGGKEIFRRANKILGEIELDVTINESNEPLVVIKGYDINSKININEEIKNLYRKLDILEDANRKRIIPFK